jgi:hypothetical protein
MIKRYLENSRLKCRVRRSCIEANKINDINEQIRVSFVEFKGWYC